MNRKNIMYIRGILVTQMNHWGLLPVMMFIFSLGRSITETFERPSLLLWMEMGILPFLFFLFRMKCKRFWMLVVSHAASAAALGALFNIQSPSAGWLYVLAAVIYVFYSIVHRLRSEDPQDGRLGMPFVVGLSAVSLFMQHYQGYPEWDSWYIGGLIAVFALYFLSSYLEHYLEFVSVNESSTGHIPEREIFSSGGRMMLLYVAFSVLVLFLTSSFGWLRAILNMVREIIFAILRVLLSGIKNEEPELTVTEMPEQSGGGGWVFPEGNEGFILWDILEVVAVVAIVGAILYVIVRLLLRLPAFIRDRMGRGRTFRTESAEGDVVDVREACAIEKPKKGERFRNPFAFLSTEERIRRLYKKHILSAGRVQKLATGTDVWPALLTAREWGQRLEQKELAAPYEKARYSGQGCTAEDLKAMKAACR